MTHDQQLKEHLIFLLGGGGAHLNFERAVEGLPRDLRGIRPEKMPHTVWQLIEHLRICQWDILQYSLDGRHESPEFPDGYWPEQDGPPTDEAWHHSLDGFRADLQSMHDLVQDPATDLFAQIPGGQPGHTVLRETLLVADHNAYHLGQVVLVRRALNAWQD